MAGKRTAGMKQLLVKSEGVADLLDRYSHPDEADIFDAANTLTRN